MTKYRVSNAYDKFYSEANYIFLILLYFTSTDKPTLKCTSMEHITVYKGQPNFPR